MAVLGPCVSVNMNGHNNIHSQLTKSLERILEDAYLSGELKLSGRKLREFPKPVKYDLSDTVVAGKWSFINKSCCISVFYVQYFIFGIVLCSASVRVV